MVGGIAGSVFVVIIFLCIIVFLVYRRKRQQKLCCYCLKDKAKKQKSTMTKELSKTNITVVVEDENHVYRDLDKPAQEESQEYEELKKTRSIPHQYLQPYEIMPLSMMASSKKAIANDRQSCIYEVPPDDGN